jgi:hypothetical protein
VFYVESAGGQPPAHFGGLKAHPEVGDLPQALVFVGHQIDDGQSSPLAEGPPGFGQGVGGSGDVVQDHAGQHRVHLAVAYGKVFQVSQPEVATSGVVACRGAGHVEHRRRRVAGDHPVGPLQQGGQQHPRAGAQVEDRAAALRQQRQRHLSVEGAVEGGVAQVGAVGTAVEKAPHLLPARFDRSFEALHVRVVLRRRWREMRLCPMRRISITSLTFRGERASRRIRRRRVSSASALWICNRSDMTRVKLPVGQAKVKYQYFLI